jgi:hypothetical protein
VSIWVASLIPAYSPLKAPIPEFCKA